LFSSHNVTAIRGGVLHTYVAPAPVEDLTALNGGLNYGCVALGQPFSSLTKAGSSDGFGSLRTVTDISRWVLQSVGWPDLRSLRMLLGHDGRLLFSFSSHNLVAVCLGDAFLVLDEEIDCRRSRQ
jgi:hypothetical protein